MRIKAGKRYVTRDGRVTGPIERTRAGWVARCDLGFGELKVNWGNGGKYLSSGVYAFDLIAEHKDPTP
jgi:hypothetical protein